VVNKTEIDDLIENINSNEPLKLGVIIIALKQLKAMQERVGDSKIIKLRYTQGYNQEQMSWDYAQGLSNADDCVDNGVKAIQKYINNESDSSD
jgi:hypothetical protein